MGSTKKLTLGLTLLLFSNITVALTNFEKGKLSGVVLFTAAYKDAFFSVCSDSQVSTSLAFDLSFDEIEKTGLFPANALIEIKRTSVEMKKQALQRALKTKSIAGCEHSGAKRLLDEVSRQGNAAMKKLKSN